jgi:epoxide hydrolase-like predicted phosphatase
MKTVFFDWGGVVANDPGDDFLTKLLQDVGATAEQIQEIFQVYMKRFMRGEISEAEYWNELRTHYGFVIQDSISDEFKKWSGLVANQDILSLVDEAKNKGWQTAILSNVIEPTYNVLQSAGFYDRFDMVIASCKEGVAKPDVKIYELALERAGATPEESIFIDDKQSNLDPAKEMGFVTVLASNPSQIIEDVRALL